MNDPVPLDDEGKDGEDDFERAGLRALAAQ